MEAPLTFEYDDVGDTLYVRKVPSYAEQETDQLAYNVFARRNPASNAVESLEVHFFTQWLLKGNQKSEVHGLGDLFGEPGRAA